MKQPHPQRCETCTIKHCPACSSKGDNPSRLPSVKWIIDKVGCATHTPAAPAEEPALPFPLSESEVCKGCATAIRKDEREQVLDAFDKAIMKKETWSRLELLAIIVEQKSLRGGAP